MPDLISNLNIEDIHISEKDKDTFNYIKKKTDFLIATLVKEDRHIKKCRDLYDGVRDPREYEYLQNTYGLETAMSLKMTPLIKTRIDVLVGLFLDELFKYQVSVNDTDTLDTIAQEKKKEKYKEVIKAFRSQLNSNQNNLLQNQQPVFDVVTERFIKQVEERVDKNFISEFEKVAQSLINFFEKDKTIELKQKLKQLFIDLLVTGKCFYRTSVKAIGQDPVLEVCKSENIFYNKNTNFQFISSGNKPNVTALVHRYYMTRAQVLSEWGHKMNEDDKIKLFGKSYTSNGGSTIIHSPQELEYIYSRERNGYLHNQHTYNLFDTVVVYHTEWLANNEVNIEEGDREDFQDVEKTTKKGIYKDMAYSGTGTVQKVGYRLNRYESIRIDYDIYLNCGKSRFEHRSQGAPSYTTLTYNGVAYNDRNGKPYSLAWSLKDLQDLYDITIFHRDNLIANSGVNGSRINLAGIPKVLGQNFMERVMKFLALRKQGIELIDPTEPGAALFQHYGDFKAALDGNAVDALQRVIESIQQQADIASGVNRYMYQAAEQRDAVSNVKTGIKQTSLITKDLFELLYNIRENILTDMINNAQICYKKGKRGSYVVGTRSVLFEVIPKNFCFTDFNIHILNVSRDFEKIQKVMSIIPQLIDRGTLEDNVAIKTAMADSATEIIDIVESSMERKEKENDQIKKLSDQLNQSIQQNKETSQALQSYQKEIDRLKNIESQLKARELQLKEKQIDGTIKYQTDMVELTKTKTIEQIKKDTTALQLEKEQIYAENAQGSSREVKNNI